jgi:hypothetical protein
MALARVLQTESYIHLDSSAAFSASSRRRPPSSPPPDLSCMDLTDNDLLQGPPSALAFATTAVLLSTEVGASGVRIAPCLLSGGCARLGLDALSDGDDAAFTAASPVMLPNAPCTATKAAHVREREEEEECSPTVISKCFGSGV